MKYICSECAYTKDAMTLPEQCPSCGADAGDLWVLDDGAKPLPEAFAPPPHRTRFLFQRQTLFITAILCLIATPLDKDRLDPPVRNKTVEGGQFLVIDPPKKRLETTELMIVPSKNGDPEGKTNEITPQANSPKYHRSHLPEPKSTSSTDLLAEITALIKQENKGMNSADAELTEFQSDPRTGAPSIKGQNSVLQSGSVGEPPKTCHGLAAPDRGIIFIVDSSVSMGLPVDMLVSVEHSLDTLVDQGDEEARAVYRQFLASSSPKRLDFAKQTFANALDHMPNGVGVGVVSFRSCDDIKANGLVQNEEFAALRRQVDGLTIRRGGETAITESLNRARAMLSRDRGRIVLITDGKETCGADPCVVHGDASSHGIVIDVVDLTGSSPVTCLAKASGGKSYKTTARLDLQILQGFVRTQIEEACTTP